jgi:hypothetical protein
VTDKFGVAINPFDVADWTAATRITPSLCMVFEQWFRQRSLRPILDKAVSLGHREIVVTWEPWTPTPLGSTSAEQGAVQVEWSNDSIVRGVHNDYIDMIARDMRDCGLTTVYLRFAHEMNGGWYPWSVDPVSYVAAWRYVRNRIRIVRNARNVAFVWAPNPDLWRKVPADWLARTLPYWPGGTSVDYVGFTMIERGVVNSLYPVEDFSTRTALARQIFAKPVIAAEVNVVKDLAVAWLGDMAAYIDHLHPYPVFILSQGPSRAQAAGNAGDLSWSAVDFVEGREAIRRLAAEFGR